MRRIIALTVVVFGIAVLGSAQTAPPSSGLTVWWGSTAKSARATDVRMVTLNGAQIYQLRGNVHIQIGDSTVRADEADLEFATREMTLRGNVRLIMPPQSFGAQFNDLKPTQAVR
jgi:lipopolysaccharide assembly outer membrane protein LptD (OstA)